MKLLLDENLSRRLVPFLQHDYPGTEHVVLAGLASASDRQVWDLARSGGFAIVTLDADFVELSSVMGPPPQVIRLRTVNFSRADTLSLLVGQRALIEEALLVRQMAVVELWP